VVAKFCQLALSRFVQKSLRRIGLSATLGDYSLAAEWLRAGTERPVISSDIQAGQRKLHLAVEHFTFQIIAVISPYYRYIFNHTKLRNCLIFANNRAETESVIAGLRQIALSEELPDITSITAVFLPNCGSI